MKVYKANGGIFTDAKILAWDHKQDEILFIITTERIFGRTYKYDFDTKASLEFKDIASFSHRLKNKEVNQRLTNTNH